MDITISGFAAQRICYTNPSVSEWNRTTVHDARCARSSIELPTHTDLLLHVFTPHRFAIGSKIKPHPVYLPDRSRTDGDQHPSGLSARTGYQYFSPPVCALLESNQFVSSVSWKRCPILLKAHMPGLARGGCFDLPVLRLVSGRDSNPRMT